MEMISRASQLLVWTAVRMRLLTIASALLSSMALAQPIITGNRISWADDDWYMVQTADTYDVICEGRDPCTVVPGNYIVRNLTTQELFPDTIITDDPVFPTESSITVEGNFISWPDNGRYQVQLNSD